MTQRNKHPYHRYLACVLSAIFS